MNLEIGLLTAEKYVYFYCSKNCKLTRLGPSTMIDLTGLGSPMNISTGSDRIKILWMNASFIYRLSVVVELITRLRLLRSARSAIANLPDLVTLKTTFVWLMNVG